jgi:ATP-dependent helicase/nuclease subunit A
MSTPGFDTSIRNQAGLEQGRAADPSVNIFVEANAGSGKTRVLVDRVTRILLSDCAPEHVLCVTYTKAAAAEMQERLFARLGKWSVMQDTGLEAELNKLGLTDQGPDQLATARRLFARALETPGGLKIQTIHAFCENLLRRFPLEAGAPPGFETLDDNAARLVFETARRTLLRGDHAVSIRAALAAGGAEAIDNILAWARSNRHGFMKVLDQAGSTDALVRQMFGLLNLAPGTDVDGVKADAWLAAPMQHLREAVTALQNYGTKTDQARANVLQAALSCTDSATAYDLYIGAFYTAKGTGFPVKSLITKGCAAQVPGTASMLSAEAERLEFVRGLVRTAQCATASAAAIRLSASFLEAYDGEMLRRRALNFDDLVELAGGLLSRDNVFAGWVGYKLDRTLSHALIDEAQDTAPRQWDMIASLTEEFFAGKGVSQQVRTLFAVGDEKQSIYSFQGAEPKRFLAEGDLLGDRATGAGMAFARPELNVSFRSAPEILRAVDQAFADIADRAPETKFTDTNATDTETLERPFSNYHKHTAARINTPGCVEIWPPTPKPEIEEETSIFAPVDALRPGSARDVLAATIAREISAMLQRGDRVWEEVGGQFNQRAVRPGDIAILVWRRTGGFFEEVIRQLKLAGVPVAGADRMILRDQTVVKDLLSLAKFGVTPGDDLALAEILRSPFFDAADGTPCSIDDDALFDLSRSRRSMRRGTLWNALFTSEDPRFAEARVALADWRNKADTEGVYDLFAGFLNARSATGETRWARLFSRLGEEARDPAEEFLSRALAHERESGGALASFIAAIDGEATQLKREMTTDRNEVQVMTVHASKGLERPVIILPDTTRSPVSSKSDGLFLHAEAGLLWSPRKADDPTVVADLRASRQAKQKAEHGRLLYVALTRARDRLIVCGWRHGRGLPGEIADESWYQRLQNNWSGEGWAEFDSPLSLSLEDCPPGRRLGQAPDRGDTRAPELAGAIDLPPWALQTARPESDTRRHVAPSSFLADDEIEEPSIFSPLSDPDGHRFRRGELIHKLLETLPDLPRDRRRHAAERFVAPRSDLSVEARQTLVDETLGILNHPDFAPLFGPGSRAEVGLTGHAPGLPAGVSVRGQVDRLVVTDHEVLIIDYKTNRPPPSDVSQVARVYLGQMAAYRELLQALHPQKSIRCALLWTDSATLMSLPDELLDVALASASA